MRTHLRAFTLIELLIVVAIIAILAAIAVPNFLEAQVRSKVARAHNDMRSLATAIEAYTVDYNHHPPSGFMPGQWKPEVHIDGGGWIFSWLDRLAPLTSPVAYITSIPKDPFATHGEVGALAPAGWAKENWEVYQYGEDYWIPAAMRAIISPPGTTMGYVTGGATITDVAWRLTSMGPDHLPNFRHAALAPLSVYERDTMEYDPTNGTTSIGDIFRYGGMDRGSRWQ